MKKEIEARKNLKKPNIILIVLDSARADVFSCYGNKLKTTPNIDKIAKEGMLFNATAKTLSEKREAKKASFENRMEAAVNLVNNWVGF